MSLLQPNMPYRIGVKFDPPLSNIRQLRELPKRTNTAHTVLVGLTQYEARLNIQP